MFGIIRYHTYCSTLNHLIILGKSFLYVHALNAMKYRFDDFVSLLRDIITYRAKLLNPDWLRQRAFFLNHEGTFGNQEGMIT